MNKNNLIITGAIIGTSLVVISAGIIFWNTSNTNSPNNTNDYNEQTSQSFISTTGQDTCTTGDRCFVPTNTNSTSPSQSINYKTVSYETEVVYSVPDGFNRLKLSVKLENGKVVDVNVTQSDLDRKSREYDRKFQSRYKSFVIGQDIDNLKLDIVSGASLTTGAFNNALEKIRQQAKS